MASRSLYWLVQPNPIPSSRFSTVIFAVYFDQVNLYENRHVPVTTTFGMLLLGTKVVQNQC